MIRATLNNPEYFTACEQGKGKERGKWKKEPVRTAKDFDFQMPVIYFMFKLTIRSQAQQQQLILTKLLSYGSWVNTIFHKLIKSVNSAGI